METVCNVLMPGVTRLFQYLPITKDSFSIPGNGCFRTCPGSSSPNSGSFGYSSETSSPRTESFIPCSESSGAIDRISSPRHISFGTSSETYRTKNRWFVLKTENTCSLIFHSFSYIINPLKQLLWQITFRIPMPISIFGNRV